MTTHNQSVDISEVVKNAKKDNANHLVHSDALSDDRKRIKDSIDACKVSILEMFKAQQDVECFKLIPNANQNHIEVSIFKDKVCFDKSNSDGSIKNLVLDFRTGTLKSNAAVLSNVDALEKLFSYLEDIYKDFTKNKATLYERKIDAD